MSSSFSIVTDYSHIPLYSPDFQLISTALQAKQTKLDTNRQKLQQARDAFGALDVAKTEDQDYLEQRLQQVSDISNKYAGGDLSNDGLTNNLISSMSQVLDDNVKSAIVGTKILRNEQSEWADKRKNDPKLYSDSNYAYAMQNANAWMNDGQTGTAYNGGGGFFEFVDTSKILMDNIPALEKALHSTWQETVPGQGAFVVTETKEKVDRGRMQDALNLLINDKARKQMHVDAWAKYDSMPDELIQQDWEKHFDAKLEQNQDYLSALKAKAAEAGPQEKAMYSDAIKGWESRVSELESTRDFNKAVNTYGRKGAYTALADDKFTTSFLDAYTYDARTISSDVGAVQRAEADYNLKQESLEETKAHHRTLEATAASKLALTKKALSSDPYKGPDNTLDPIDGSTAATDIHHKAAANLKSKVEDNLARVVYGVKDGKASDSQIGSVQAILRSPDFAKKMASADFIGAKSINIGGKEISFAAYKQLRGQLIDYQEEFLQTSQTKKDAFVPLEKGGEEIRATLYQAMKRGETKINEIPVYNMRHVDNGDGTYTIKEIYDTPSDPNKIKLVDNKSKNNYYRLLYKEQSGGTLSPLEKKDLQLYTNIHMTNDKTLTASKKALMYEKMASDLEGVDAKGFKLATAISKKKLNTSYTSDMHLSDITKSDVKGTMFSSMDKFDKAKIYRGQLNEAIKTGSYGNVNINIGSFTGTPQENRALALQKIKEYETTINSPDALRVKGVDTIFKDSFKQAEGILESRYVGEQTLPSSASGIYSKSNKGQLPIYNALVAKLHDAGSETSGSTDIKVSPVIDPKTNLPTGDWEISQNSGKKDVGPYTTIIPQAEAKAITGSDIAYTTAKYNAGHPGAKPVNLGNGVYKNSNSQGGFADANDAKVLRETAAAYGQGGSNLASELIDNYKAGRYVVKLIPDIDTKMYYPVIYQKGANGKLNMTFDEIPAEPVARDITDLIEQFQGGDKQAVDNIIYNAIMSQINNYAISQQ
jgi:hypothetical protein